MTKNQSPKSKLRSPMVRLSWLALLAAALTPAPAHAVAIYTASATSCQNNFSQGEGPQTALVNQNQCSGFSGNAFAQSSEFGLGASAQARTFGTAAGTQALATVSTMFRIIGPAGSGPVLASLNLALTAGVNGGIVDGYSQRGFEMGVNLGGVGQYFTSFAETSTSTGRTYFFNSNNPQHIGYNNAVCQPCQIVTPTVLIPVNTDLAFFMRLFAYVSSNGVADGSANAANTLYFPLDGPVFNLPEGYTAVIEGLNVADNRVVGASEAIPEPATTVLMALALAAFWVRKASPLC